jgi:NAD(P)-dependent dehydrogenase (short-subunit alcohol dehydrogenase family)
VSVDGGQLAGRIVVVTGAARGVGRACATACAAAGADLMLIDVAADLPGVPYPLGSRSQLDHTADECRALGAHVESAVADVRDMTALAAVRDRVLDRFGTVDALINNAGVVSPSGRPVHETSEADWQLLLDINLSGAWRMIHLFVPAMLRHRRGSVVNIASTAGLVGYRHFGGYVAAKHGLVGLTKAAALDYAPAGVRVNAVCPGNISDEPSVEGRALAEVARALDVPVAGHEKLFTTEQPMNTLIDPDDVASAARWLCTDEARHVTGTCLTVDAGYVVR